MLQRLDRKLLAASEAIFDWRFFTCDNGYTIRATERHGPTPGLRRIDDADESIEVANSKVWFILRCDLILRYSPKAGICDRVASCRLSHWNPTQHFRTTKNSQPGRNSEGSKA